MARNSKISWTGSTWNPIRGCSRVSSGCKNCYAERVAHRYNKPGMWADGLTVIRSGRPGWSGRVDRIPDKLDEPLRWQKPQRIFPCSGADIFHEKVPFEYIAAMFGVMAAARRHTFQVLTKRAKREREFFEWLLKGDGAVGGHVWQSLYQHARAAGVAAKRLDDAMSSPWPWPLPNVWLGVSAEDQANVDTRVAELVRTPAAVRWVSAEPLLERITLRDFIDGLDWGVVGGESGRPGVDCRPCAMEWIDEVKDEFLDARKPVFVKQLGSWVVSEDRMAESVDEANVMRRGLGHVERDDRWMWSAGLRDAKGEEPHEWPEHMQVRLFPGDELPEPGAFRYDARLPGEECPF